MKKNKREEKCTKEVIGGIKSIEYIPYEYHIPDDGVLTRGVEAVWYEQRLSFIITPNPIRNKLK